MMVAVLSATAIRYVLKAEAMAKEKREADYQSALQAHSQNLKPGLSRKEVETYFRVRDIRFGQMGWLEKSAFADLVRIGQEAAPWYCSANYVNIAFEFAATEPHQPWTAYDTDVLKRVLIFRQLAGCL